MTYIASDVPLETIEWRPGAGVAICPLRNERTNFDREFELPHKYVVASSEGCGCGFLMDGNDEVKAERTSLGRVIEKSFSEGQRRQLLICYAGEESKPVTMRVKSPTNELDSVQFDKGWDYEVILVEVTPARPV